MEETLKRLLAIGGVTAAIYYGVLRLAYLQFYYPLGVSPESVGIDRTQIITQAIVGPIVLAAIPAMAVLLAHLALALPSSTATPRYIDRLRAAWLSILLWTGGAFAVVTIFTLGFGYADADNLGHQMRDHGESITNDYSSFGPIAIPILEINAVPARVEWKDAANKPRSVPSDNCLMYLGQANGVATLYDVHAGTTIRLSADDIILHLDTISLRLPEACRPDK